MATELWIDDLECLECHAELCSPPVHDGMRAECESCGLVNVVRLDEDGGVWQERGEDVALRGKPASGGS